MVEKIDKDEYLRKVMPPIEVEEGLSSYVTDTLLNKNNAVYQPIKVACISPMARMQNETDGHNIALRKLELPVIPSLTLKAIQAKKEASSRKSKGELIVRHILKRIETLSPKKRSTSTPIEIDGVKFNPEDYHFSKLKTQVSDRESFHREVGSAVELMFKQNNGGRKMSVPHIRERHKDKKDKKHVYYRELKQKPAKLQNDRLNYIAKNQKYGQALLLDINNRVAAMKKNLNESGESTPVFDIESPKSERFSNLAAVMLGLPKQLPKDKSGRRQQLGIREEEMDPRKIPIRELMKKRKEANKYGYKRTINDIEEIINAKLSGQSDLISNGKKFSGMMDEIVACSPRHNKELNSLFSPERASFVKAKNLNDIKKEKNDLKELKRKYETPYKRSAAECEVFKGAIAVNDDINDKIY